jgi:SRSO17 transposase
VQAVLAEVEGWAAQFERLLERIGPRFARPKVRRRAAGFLRGLLGDVERKNGWQLAEHARETTPDGMQRLLTTARWDADALRDDVRAYVVEHLGDPGRVLVVDETGFLEKGSSVYQELGCVGDAAAAFEFGIAAVPSWDADGRDS